MLDRVAPGLQVWLELGIVLGAGGLLIAAAAAVFVPRLRGAAWQRTVWQAAILGLLVLLAAELTGAGGALVRFASTSVGPSRASSETPQPAAAESPGAAAGSSRKLRSPIPTMFTPAPHPAILSAEYDSLGPLPWLLDSGDSLLASGGWFPDAEPLA